MLKKIITASMLSILFCTTSFALEQIDPVVARWSHENTFTDKDGDQTVRLKATYFSNEYVEALVASEAEKNLWTEDEAENYKYQLLKNINMAETIPFRIELYVRGIPMYPGPFDRHITLYIGKNKYTPVDYDKSFNFRLQGAREGMVFFPRYDPKTGKNLLENVKDIRLVFDSSISIAMMNRGDPMMVWDLTRDRGTVGGGKAATRMEIDRLIKRNDKLNADREALRKQLEALDKEFDEVNTRIDELQAE